MGVGHSHDPPGDSESLCYKGAHIRKRLLYDFLSIRTYQEEFTGSLRFLVGSHGSPRNLKHIEWGTIGYSIRFLSTL